jgi:hypothetical protein
MALHWGFAGAPGQLNHSVQDRVPCRPSAFACVTVRQGFVIATLQIGAGASLVVKDIQNPCGSAAAPAAGAAVLT